MQRMVSCLYWNKGNIVLHTHMRFLCNVYPYTPLFPIFVAIFTFLGLFPPQMVHLLPVPNMEWACMNFVSSLLWALLRRQGLGGTGVVASQDPTPRRGWGGPPPLDKPKNGSTEQCVLWASG